MMNPPKPPRMPVYCTLADCCYHSEETGQVYCGHPDKPMHAKVEPCPLYRLDWKKAKQAIKAPEKKPKFRGQ